MGDDSKNEARPARKTESSVRHAAGYAGKGIILIIPALIGSYVTFREAKLSSDLKLEELRLKHEVAIMGNKGNATAGYETLVGAVERLGREVAKLEGRLLVTEGRVYGTASASRRRTPVSLPSPSPARASTAPTSGPQLRLSSPSDLEPTILPPLPQTLEDAVRQRKK